MHSLSRDAAAHRGIEQKEGLRQRIGMLLNHSQRLRLEEILLICIASAGVNGARGAVVSPEVNARKVLSGMLGVAGVDGAAALLAGEVVILVVEVYKRAVEASALWDVLRCRPALHAAYQVVVVLRQHAGEPWQRQHPAASGQQPAASSS